MKTSLVLFLYLPGILLPLAAGVVYDNSVNDLHYQFPVNTQEIGDEIKLAGTNRVLTHFQFEYWGIFETNAEACVRFYRNDQPDPDPFFPSPGTKLFDSGFFRVDTTPRLALIFDDFVTDAVLPLTRLMPDSFTWTIQFRGLGPNDTAGVALFSPPRIGTAFRDYWVNNGGEWELKTTPDLHVNFSVWIAADPIVPPKLTAASAPPGNVALSWPVTRLMYRLEQTASLGAAAVWSGVTNAPAQNGQTWAVDLPITGNRRFFRLVNP